MIEANMDTNVSPSPIKFHYPYGRVGVVANPIEETCLFDSLSMRWPDNKDIEVQGRTITHRTPMKRTDPSAVGADTL